ncbi:MAG TPA: inositol monophosphatase family protein [Candidatus Limnocylindrales bacterium]|nr:inositol monophosphatase family protein [Candidatus Limnocylindrales bacterium]
MATAPLRDPAPLDAARQLGLERELAVALDAARRAGAIQVERYERLERIVHKSAHDVVTEVDTLSEELIIATIRATFPTDLFLAEESGHSGHSDHMGRPAAAAAPAAMADRLWVIDPLDGTVNYANGIPIFCVSIGLVVGGQPRVGVLLDPARDDLYCAVAGGGAFLNDVPIHLPVKEKLSDCVVFLALPPYGFARREWRIRKRIRVSRVLGSSALGLAYVGNGRFDAFVQPRGLSPWDVAAAGLIAQEGGATVTDGEGGQWFDLERASRGVGILAAAPAHHATLLEHLR